MKNFRLLAGMFVMLLLTGVAHVDYFEVNIPRPTVILPSMDEDEDFHKEKEFWIESMHKTAPGVDWRAIDEETRQSKRILRNTRSKSTTPEIEEIVPGILSGKWTEKGSNNMAGRMHCVDVDFERSLVYAASSGGNIWRGSLAGDNWECLTDYYQLKGVHFIRIFPNEAGGHRIMMCNQSPVFYYSDDEGASWNKATGLKSMQGGRLIRGISHDDGKIYLQILKGSHSYFYYSIDLGTTFSKFTDNVGSAQTDSWSPRFGEGGFFMADKTKIYQLNAENKWENIGNVGVNFSDSEIKRVQLNGSVKDGQTFLYVMYRLEKSTRFAASSDGGLTWALKEQIEEGPFMSNSFGVSTIDPLLLGFGGVNAYRSINGGQDWVMVNGWGEYYGDKAGKLHADIPEIEFIRKPDGSELCFVSTDGGSFVSKDNLLTVNNISLAGLRVSQYYSTYTHRELPQVIYVGSQDQGFQRSVELGDGLVNFEQTISGDYGHIVSSDKGNSFWTVYPGFAMRYPNAISANNNVTWSFTGENHYWMPPLMEDPYFPERAYLAGGTSTTGNHLWYLDHRGNSIVPTELPFDFSDGNENARIAAMAYSPLNKDYRYVINSDGKFFFSSNRGIDWEKSTNRGPGSHYFYGNAIIPDPLDINTIYLGGSGYSGHSAWVSYDGGGQFEALSEGLPNTLIFEMAINEDGSLLFAASEVGPYVYLKSLGEWFALEGSSAPEQTYWTVDYVPMLKTARFGTYGRGIWDFEISSFTGREEIHLSSLEEGIPVGVYPNPVSELANLQFTLLEPGGVQIRIFDQAGRLLMQQEFMAERVGRQEIQIDASAIPLGIAYLVIQSGNRRGHVKMIRQ